MVPPQHLQYRQAATKSLSLYRPALPIYIKEVVLLLDIKEVVLLLDSPLAPHTPRRPSVQRVPRHSPWKAFLLLCCEPEDYAYWASERPEDPSDRAYRATLETATARARSARTYGAFRRFCEDCHPQWQQRMTEEGRCVRTYVLASPGSRPSAGVTAGAGSASTDYEGSRRP